MDFTARVGTAGGQILERTFQADNEDALRRDLDAKGYYIFTVKKDVGSGASLLSVFKRRKRVPMREFIVFNHKLATLLKAGLPLLQGLDILIERMSTPVFRDVLVEIRDQVKGGTALSEAFAEYPEYFPSLYATSLRAGERSGELESVIRRYIAYTKVMDEVRKQVRQALVYPGFLLGASLAAIYILLTFAMPQFADMYRSFDAELPLLTRVLIAMSEFFSNHKLGLLFACIALAGVLKLVWESERGRLVLDRVKMRVPFLGAIWQKFAVSQLTRALETLLTGGIPLVTALDVATDSVGNRLIATRVSGVVQNIREGESLSDALIATDVMQPMVIEMVKVGESTGALAEMLGNVADYYDEDIRDDLQRFLSFLEPALLLTMGIVIAVMLLAMYMPLFELQTKIN